MGITRDPYAEAFVDLVEKMRSSQKSYFTHRRTEDLKQAKEYEKQVDQYIANHRSPELFNHPA